VIALKNPTIPDFDFLGLSRMYPPTTRFSDPRTEDEFCKKLLLLGAKWYDSLSRFYFLRCAGGEAPDTLCIEALENGSEPLPTVRERTWVSIAWPSAGGLVVAEWNTLMYGYGKDDDMFLPDEELGRLRLCKNMDEKALILMDWFEGKEIEDIQAYKGNSWLRIWDSKVGGEHGKMENTWHNGIEEK
jgi:hypothetical protein